MGFARDNRARQRALLVEMLSGGALPFDMISREAKARGINFTAVRDVRKELGIIVRGTGPEPHFAGEVENR
jgi:hypothetical protein